MNRLIMLPLAACVVWVSGCTLADKKATITEARIVTRIVPLTLTRMSPPPLTCPSGDAPIELSTSVCQEPIEYNCTAYYCTDASGNQFLMSLPAGRPNPECKQAQMQTEACTNDVKIPERYLPSRRELVDTMPRFYPKAYLEVPLIPTK